MCLKCPAIYSRFDIQDKLKIANPNMPDISSMIRPDGDVDIPQVCNSNYNFLHSAIFKSL